jgi:hypothetical protein
MQKLMQPESFVFCVFVWLPLCTNLFFATFKDFIRGMQDNFAEPVGGDTGKCCVLIMLQADRQMETFVFIIPRRMIVLQKYEIPSYL